MSKFQVNLEREFNLTTEEGREELRYFLDYEVDLIKEEISRYIQANPTNAQFHVDIVSTRSDA